MLFKDKVLKIVRDIPLGSFLSYKEVAKKSGNQKAYRVVANLMAKNTNSLIPCHRVIKNNNEIGGYKGSFRNSYKKVGLLLKEGAIGVIPTDTLYGISGSAFNQKTVEKIYKLRKRNPKKPMIILLSCLKDLDKFHIKLSKFQKQIISKIWPSKVSIVLRCPFKDFNFLHRGLKTLAFRLPKKKELREILKISGPLVAPSANYEGEKPAQTINEAKKYFGKKVFYYNKGKLKSPPSTLIDLTTDKIKLLRKGSDFNKVENYVKIEIDRSIPKLKPTR